MFSPFERLLAMRYLRARRKEGFISVIAIFSFLGIMLGVAILIIVMAVMNGFRHDLMDKILGFNGHLLVQSTQGPMTDYDVVTKAVRSLPMVKSADPIIQAFALVTENNYAAGVQVRGMRPEDFKARPQLASSLIGGDLGKFTGTDVVMIGDKLAATLGIGIGGQLTLISPQSTTTMIGQVPRIKSYEVVGVFKFGQYEYDNAYVFMPLEAAQLYFKQPQAAGSIEVVLDNPDDTNTAASVIQARIGTGFRIASWEQLYSDFFGVVAVERNVMFLILAMVILVAAFNVISGQIMLVKDKGRDIAILRTMGATRGMIMRIFLLSGASIGVVGTAAGFALGLLVSLNIEPIRQFLQLLLRMKLFPEEFYYLSRLPATVETGDVVAVVVMSLTLSFLATLYPSWRAARLDPVEALRYE
ncbi:MAG TPA: lipoprotein-releasing ABC transporter permease subunit [Dongiaceae bacterium]|jgi:lipoprotein-releasing system permease protein|nr:lipoprotein-releasing ABC transporter permease subunit [Dongiaceae bacterium]